MKLNVDATVGRSQAAGGAILRNDQGLFLSAICFALPSVNPLRTELLTLTMALIHFSMEWDLIVVETDCYTILSMLSSDHQHTGFLAT